MACSRAAIVLALMLAAGACAPGFPERAADVDMAGDPALCPDFRALHLDSPVEPQQDWRLSANDRPLGCATARSLRVMLAYPSDLDPAPTGPARSVTAGAAVERYATDTRKALIDTQTTDAAP